MIFKDRKDAGKSLAQALEKYESDDAVILALPRGGTVLGYEVARHLQAPLSLSIAQKIGHPLSAEYAIGAITRDGTYIINEEEKRHLSSSWLESEKAVKQKEAQRRYDTYLKGRKTPSLQGKVVILVDDGLATGYTMRVAVKAVKASKPGKIVVAVPVASSESIGALRDEVDDIICLYIPPSLGAIGAYYEDFNQVSDDEVIELLNAAEGSSL